MFFKSSTLRLVNVSCTAKQVGEIGDRRRLGPLFDGRSGHGGEIVGRVRMERETSAPAMANGPNTARPVLARAGQDDAEELAAVTVGRRLEERVDGGPGVQLGFVERKRKGSIFFD
jgi:hypothetical protein